jgi:hypothetical protein
LKEINFEQQLGEPKPRLHQIHPVPRLLNRVHDAMAGSCPLADRVEKETMIHTG